VDWHNSSSSIIRARITNAICIEGKIAARMRDIVITSACQFAKLPDDFSRSPNRKSSAFISRSWSHPERMPVRIVQKYATMQTTPPFSG
jgi:hypothetical protein